MMNEIWIYLYTVLWIFPFEKCFGQNIFVNINLDYLPDTSQLKIYNGVTDVSACNYLRNDGKFIYLPISKNLTSRICKSKSPELTFNIFTYQTNITPALITIRNRNYSIGWTRDSLLKISPNAVIVNFDTDYVNFVICENNSTDCQYRSVDQRDMIKADKNLIIYSACEGSTNGSTCITDIEFTTKWNDADSKPDSIGSQIIMKKSNMEQFYGPLQTCRNGGTIINGTASEIAYCDCPKTDDFLERGPQCEVLQLALVYKQYLYVLPNTNQLRIEFSLYSIGNQGNTEIFRILNATGLVFMKYNVIQAIQRLEILGSIIEIPYALDQNNKWLQMLIIISQSRAIFQVNEKEASIVINTAGPLNFDTYPLIFSSLKDRINDICMSNLKINNRIVDLFMPLYVNCRPNCGKCKPNQTCLFVPFKSDANADCVCKSGFTKGGTNDCVKDDKMISQIPRDKGIQINPPRMEFMGVQFRFRTLSNNGNIVTLILSRPTGYNVTIGVLTDFLFAKTSNVTSSKILLVDFYVVTDGRWHSVNLVMDHNSLELKLDEYYTKRMLFERGFFSIQFTYAETNQFTLGTMSGTLGLSTCFDTFSLIPADLTREFFTMPENINMSKGCNGGPNCTNFACKDNQKCLDAWQNRSCVCVDGFSDINGTCFFTKCLSVPCLNGGRCFYDSNSRDYKCDCVGQYTGRNCEIDMKSATFLWWIILLIILILLLIFLVLLLYCCCFKKRKENKNVPDIDKVHENTVCYNDQAGEVDYTGPPINFNIMKSSLNQPKMKPKAPEYPTDDLQKRKHYIDASDNGLNIDHPLEYGYEGFNSDAGSVSSLGSGSTDEQLNIQPLHRTDNKFDYLKNLYE